MSRSATHRNTILTWENTHYEDNRGATYRTNHALLRGIATSHTEEAVAALSRVRQVGAAALAAAPPPSLTPTSDEERHLFRSAWDYGTTLRDSGATLLGINLLVFAERYRVCASIDVAVRNGSTTHIMAWHIPTQTNTPHKWCGEPLEHLVDTPLTRVALLLSLDARLLRDGRYLPQTADIELDVITVTPDGAVSETLPHHEREAADVLLYQLFEIPF